LDLYWKIRRIVAQDHHGAISSLLANPDYFKLPVSTWRESETSSPSMFEADSDDLATRV